MRTLLFVAVLLAACTDAPAVPSDATLDSDVADAADASSDAYDASQEPPNAPVADAGIDADR